VTASTPPLVDEDLRESDTRSRAEREANEQASEWICPGGFKAPAGPISASSIADAALIYGVDPSMVIGRLQRGRGRRLVGCR